MSHCFEGETFLADAVSFNKISSSPIFDMKTDFFDALSAGDIDRAASVFAVDGVLLFPGLRPVKGRPLVKRLLGVIRRRYEDIAWRPTGPTLSAQGWVVTTWTVAGTFRQTGAAYDNEVLSLVRLDSDGRIAMLSDYFKDTLAFHPTQSAAPKPIAVQVAA
jgi:ketosteroid isomerase-like protein